MIIDDHDFDITKKDEGVLLVVHEHYDLVEGGLGYSCEHFTMTLDNLKKLYNTIEVYLLETYLKDNIKDI